MGKYGQRIWIGLMVMLGSGSCFSQLISTFDPVSSHNQIIMNLDELEDTWEVRYSRKVASRNEGGQSSVANPALPDENEIRSELDKIEGDLNFNFIPKVKEFVRLYAFDKRKSTESMLGLGTLYFPVIEDQLEQRNMPLNLKYFPVALSALNTRAVSEKGSAGLWQLHYHTGIRYGLHCSQSIDERRDLHKSTIAALDYLEDLHELYGDWILACVAYTCGPGSITKARNRAKGDDYKDLYDFLPEYGRDYLPAFVAAAYVMNNYERLGLDPVPICLPAMPDRIQLQEPLRLSSVSRVLDISMSELMALNPSCRDGLIPGSELSCQLCLPKGLGLKFTQLKDSIYNVETRLVTKEKAEIEQKPVPVQPEVVKIENEGPPSGYSTLRYKIKPGDNLGLIAELYGVSVSKIKSWNGLGNDYIRAGDELKIYVPEAKVDEMERINVLTHDQKMKKLGYEEPKVVEKKSPEPEFSGEYRYYTVKPGDNLWQIAKNYPGVSAENIMELNNISEDLQPGQKLKIPILK